ncbi:glycosyltransferase family 4 protein [Companilactobacillus mishanensis]|uniref:Glycosyltransferase family 4 protein n=1 Tax=Companilactobacillus mishanensis TaxID=2486008 RepID=A0A5P0ZKL9_9LACO|nr:glycosyltransferase family 4 protein [Companilactobacillus mishanensis]MQS46110.1 glycosyltransferase family 4 protein [Companilactobacillus mishanensis]MQS53598.1 glycosyltransferase family 4 protein [Companilactobacillus mishanensis]
MNIGIFTDTYFPQVSGVATSIQTLKNDLERKGHSVYIFTTTDPNVSKTTIEPNIFRLGSVPFISFTDRRIAIRGMFHAVDLAKELKLDVIHTQTEFSLGLIGKFVAKQLKIPFVHTYHTMYEDYLHYVLNGKLLKPYHVKQMTRMFVKNASGVVAPSKQVKSTLDRYKIDAPISIIPTGVDLSEYTKPVDTSKVRASLGLSDDTPVILMLSRIALEKKIDHMLRSMPELLKYNPKIMLVIVGDGPDMDELVQMSVDLGITDNVIFTGEVEHDKISPYYHMANIFVSSSDTESQGLTYIEAIASGLKIVVRSAPYTDQLLTDPSVGVTFNQDDQLVPKIIAYLDHPKSFDDRDARQRILYNISSDNFGNSVLNFYHTAQEYFVREKLSNSSIDPEEYSND